MPTTYISVRELRTSLSSLLARLSAGEVVITQHGKPVALLTIIDADHLEEQVKAIRKALASIAVQEMRQMSRTKGQDTMPLKRINEEIAGSRKARHARRS